MATALVMNDITECAEEPTCGICLEEPKDPLDLPCGHSFCDGCINEWRSRYGVKEGMRTKCPICRARIPPSKEMVSSLLSCRALKQKLKDENASSADYNVACEALARAEAAIGADWDGVTVLQDNKNEPPLVISDYITRAMKRGDIKTVLTWINANQAEDRANAISSAEWMRLPVLSAASMFNHLTLATLLLQQGANVNTRNIQGITAMTVIFYDEAHAIGVAISMARLLLSWGINFEPGDCVSREECACTARNCGAHELANLIESELGGRRCEIINLSSRPELNGKTCVADQYLPGRNRYQVTLETKSKEVFSISPINLMRRDRTPQDCGYYIEFKNGRTVRHDFDSNEECKAFVAALNEGEAEPVVSKEAAARADEAVAELLAELGLENAPNGPSSGCPAKKPKKKKKAGKKKKIRQ